MQNSPSRCVATNQSVDRTKINLMNGLQKEELEPFYYFRRNPILCGLMSFRSSLSMNELGLAVTNSWGSTIAAAHLYNALRHELPNFPQWLDMEALILIHSTDRIFWRPDLPSTTPEYSKSYDDATGIGKMLAQLRAGHYMVSPDNISQRGIGAVSVVSSMYHERFCYDHRRKVHNLPEVEQILNSSSQKELERSLCGLRLLVESPSSTTLTTQAPDRALTTQFEETRTLTKIQLLETLCARVSEESYALNFDYFSFHERCTLLLQGVYEEFKSEVVEISGQELDGGSGELPCGAYWIFKLMEDAEKKDMVLERLGRVMEGVVREESGNVIADLREFLGTDRVARISR